MTICRLSAALTVATVLAQPGLVLGQTEDHEQHHPAAEATAAAAQPMEQQSDATGEQVTPAGTGEEGPAPGSEVAGSGMMGSGMMSPEMMRMMHEGMMRGAERGPGAAPVIVIVPVPGSGTGPGMPMMADGMMPTMAGAGMAMHRGAGAPEAISAGRSLAAGAVTPALHLSVKDVRHFFEHRLDEHGNPRLTLGEVAEAGEDAITAEIVTSDGSLVERLSVDRHSGAIRPLR